MSILVEILAIKIVETNLKNFICVSLKVDTAIKTLNDNHASSGKSSFLREAEIMMKLDHSCIVKLIGICEGPPLMIVSYIFCYLLNSYKCCERKWQGVLKTLVFLASN